MLDQLNSRRKDSNFVSKVNKRFETLCADETILLVKLIASLKEKGVENENDQMIMSQAALQEVAGLRNWQFEKAIKYGIENNNFEKETKKEKIRIVLVSDIIGIENQDKRTKEDLLKKIVEFIKEGEEETEDGFLYVLETTCKQHLEVDDAKFEAVVKIGITKKVLRRDMLKGSIILCYMKERRSELDM